MPGSDREQAIAALADLEQRKSNDLLWIRAWIPLHGLTNHGCTAHRRTMQQIRTAWVYVPDARPATRFPHMWHADGTAVQETLGPGRSALRARVAVLGLPEPTMPAV